MKKIVVKYGLISGIVIASLMLVTTLITKSIGYEKVGFEWGALIGYTNIFLALIAVYLGIKNYRDHFNENKLSLKEGLIIGFGISIISCVFYSLMWLFIYYNIIPDFMDHYASYSLDKMKSEGASALELAKHEKGINSIKEMYKSPVSIFFITMTEPLPVALLVTLGSAFILKSK